MTLRVYPWLLAGLGLLAVTGWLVALGVMVAPDWRRAPEPAAPERGSVLAATLGSTVQVFAEREGGGRGAGSAVVLSVDAAAGRSLLLTSGHLLTPRGAEAVHMASPDGGEQLELRVLAVDAALDLALLEAPTTLLRPVTLTGEVLLGDRVWVVAFPWGRERTVVQGVVSQLWQPTTMSGFVRLIDASVSYGMSGGGVFDATTGELIGVVQGYRTAQLTVPGTEGQRLNLPVAGETTVVSADRVTCFLLASGYDDLVPASLRAGLRESCAALEES